MPNAVPVASPPSRAGGEVLGGARLEEGTLRPMGAQVRAAVQRGPRDIVLQSFERPAVGPDDGLLRVEACGICGSDVEQYKGHLGGSDRPPSIPGHEILGVIEEVGERAAERWGVSPGDRVAVEIIIPCRSCARCLTGRYMSCRNRHGAYSTTPVSKAPALWGGYAEYMYLHPNTVMHKVRADIPPEIAVMFNPLGAGVRWAVDLGGTGLGDTVLILGAGQRGIASVIAARAVGAGTIIVTGLRTDKTKLDLARRYGADHTIVVEDTDTVDRVLEITDGAGADVVLELTPMAREPVQDALRAVRHGGTIVFAGLKGQQEIPLRTDQIINKGVTVKGAYGVDFHGYEQAIRIIESGAVPLAALHTHSFRLDDAANAVETLAGEGSDGHDAVHVAILPHL